MLTNKKFIKYAQDKLVVFIVHNERGHDSIEGKDYDGKPVFLCPLYPGLTCQQHCDAAVDVDGPRDEFLVKVPFISLCPNSWLVPPVGEPVQITEEDQFVAAKVQKAVDAMQKSLGASLPSKSYVEARNVLASFDSDLEDEAFEKALRSLAGLEGVVKKPHKSLLALVDTRLAEAEEQIRWAYEDAVEVGAKDDTPFSVRVSAVRALVKAASPGIYGKHLPVLAEMQAWLKDNKDKAAPRAGK